MYLLKAALQIVMLLILVLIGMMLRHKRVFTDQVTKGVNTLLLKTAWPAAILMSSQKDLSPEQIPEVFNVLFISLIIMTVTCLAVFFLFKGRVKKHQLAVFAGVSSIPNVIYVGIPVIGAIYGDLGIIYLSGTMIALNIVMWTVFHIMIQDGGERGRVLRSLLNPGIAASLLSVIFILTGLRLPEPLLSLINHLGNMTIPISMMLVGVRLKETVKPQMLSNSVLWLSLTIRLLVIPVAVALLLRFFGLSGITYGVLVIASALPAAASPQFMAEQYNRDTALAAQGSSISLLACLLTLPLVMVLAGI